MVRLIDQLEMNLIVLTGPLHLKPNQTHESVTMCTILSTKIDKSIFLVKGYTQSAGLEITQEL